MSYFNEFLQKMSGKVFKSHGRMAIPVQENKKQKKLINSWKFIDRPPLRLLSIIYELNDNFLLRLVNTEYLPKK